MTSRRGHCAASRGRLTRLAIFCCLMLLLAPLAGTVEGVIARVPVDQRTYPAVPGITITQGQSLTITATGTACYDTDCNPPVSPDGSGLGPGGANFKLPGAPQHSLVCGVGGQSPSDLFFVGSSFSGQATSSGSLFCGMNEMDIPDVWPDNSGSWTVTVTMRTLPTLTFSATPTTISAGQSATLTWSTTNATSCTASGGWAGTKSVRGSQAVSPTATTTYTLTCSGSGGSVTRSVTVTSIPVISLIPCLPIPPHTNCSGTMKTIDITPGESVIVSVATGTVSAPLNVLAARFGLEFRVGGSACPCYVARSVNVGPSNYEYPPFNALPGGLPNVGFVLPDTAQNTTYYMRLTNPSPIPRRVYVQADLKEIKVHPMGPAVSASEDNYFISHGRNPDGQDNYHRNFEPLRNKLAAKINNANSRYFLIDWSGAAASNYPTLWIPGLQGSRFIVPAGNALKELVVTGQGVPASKITVWGHSWGSYVSSEFAKASGSNFKALVGLDPAETTSLGGFIGNAYSNPNLQANASHSFALVATHGLYGGQDEADTADLSIQITARKANGDILGDNDRLHSVPVRCMEYALLNYHSDAVSEALVRGALWQPGPRDRTIVDQDPDHPDATMDGYTNDSGNNYTGHGPLTNGSVTISP